MNEFAWRIIEALSSPKSSQQLAEETALPERTLRYNLSILKRKGIVKEISVLNDMRRKLFSSVIRLADIAELKEHEKTDKRHVKELKKEIFSEGILKMPIVADRKTKVILDGHHRFSVLKELGYKKIPVLFVDYNSEEIQVETWRKGEEISKEEIINAGLKRKKLPSKSSKHMIRIGKKLSHISAIENRIDFPLNPSIKHHLKQKKNIKELI